MLCHGEKEGDSEGFGCGWCSLGRVGELKGRERVGMIYVRGSGRGRVRVKGKYLDLMDL